MTVTLNHEMLKARYSATSGRSCFGSQFRPQDRGPATGVCNSLDGLIVNLSPREKGISVFRRLDAVDGLNRALYTWNNYMGKNLDEEEKFYRRGMDKKLAASMKELDVKVHEFIGQLTGSPTPSFTANYIKGAVLYGGKSENIYKQYEELSYKEFRRCCKILKRRYPALYEDTEFKRTIKIGRRFRR